MKTEESLTAVAGARPSGDSRAVQAGGVGASALQDRAFLKQIQTGNSWWEIQVSMCNSVTGSVFRSVS